jgi:hypothetical protein
MLVVDQRMKLCGSVDVEAVEGSKLDAAVDGVGV